MRLLLICNYVFQFYRKDEAASRPKVEFVPKSLTELNIEGVSTEGLNGTSNHHGTSIITSQSYQISRFTKPVPPANYIPQPLDPWSFPQGIDLKVFF